MALPMNEAVISDEMLVMIAEELQRKIRLVDNEERLMKNDIRVFTDEVHGLKPELEASRERRAMIYGANVDNQRIPLPESQRKGKKKGKGKTKYEAQAKAMDEHEALMKALENIDTNIKFMDAILLRWTSSGDSQAWAVALDQAWAVALE